MNTKLSGNHLVDLRERMDTVYIPKCDNCWEPTDEEELEKNEGKCNLCIDCK